MFLIGKMGGGKVLKNFKFYFLKFCPCVLFMCPQSPDVVPPGVEIVLLQTLHFAESGASFSKNCQTRLWFGLVWCFLVA